MSNFIAKMQILIRKNKTLQATNATLIKQRDDLKEALETIKKGEGAFSRDKLTHAENVIKSIQEIAKAALAQCKEKP
jgi:hypothetical protein